MDPYSAKVTWHRGLAWVAAGITGVIVVAAAWLTTAEPTPGHILALAAGVVLGVVPAASGTIVSTVPRTGVLGPLLVLPGLLAALVVTLVLAEDILPAPAGADYVTVASQGAWVLVYVVVAMPLLFFPAGRLTTRMSRWLLAVILADAGVFITVAATAPGPFLPPDETTPHVFGTMSADLATVLTAVSLPLLPLTMIVLVIDLVHRYRCSDAERRRQYRWLALGAGLLPLTLLGTWTSYALIGNADVVLVLGLSATYLALPALIGVAVCRPDLFDADRVLVDTVSRSLIVAGLLSVYTGANVVAGALLTRRSPAVAIAVTAGAAMLLAPLGRRLRRSVGARLYPARHAAFTTIDDLHRETLHAYAAPEQLEERLRAALADPSLVIGYCRPSSGVVVDADGIDLELPEPWVDIRIGSERIGVFSTRAPITGELRHAIADRCAPLVELVRLRLELRQALNDAEDSQARLLRAGYEERMRLERDLHDGAQQRLVALGMTLRLAQRRAGRGADVTAVFDEAVAELGTAVTELRQLAHGIRPSCLDDGLVPALSQLVSTTHLPIVLRVTSTHLDQDVETTAYYVAAEAITNAIKHADATAIALDVDEDAGQVHLRVTDNGNGRARAHPGSGLARLADRVGAHGGQLAIRARRGSGTVIEAVLPCAS
jgi:signal transduction histidine kinase